MIDQVLALLFMVIALLWATSLTRSFIQDVEFFEDGSKPRQEMLRLLLFALSSPFWCVWHLLRWFVAEIAQIVIVLWRNDPIGSEPREESNTVPDVKREPAARGRKLSEK